MTPNKTPFDFEQLGPHDVLLGRGTGTNEYIGNVRFRETIRGIVDESGIEKFDGHVKTELAQLIVARIRIRVRQKQEVIDALKLLSVHVRLGRQV